MVLPEILFKTSYKNFKNIILDHLSLKDYENVEIEARIGKIVNLITKKRVEMNISHPIVFDQLPFEYVFESSVEKKDFNQIKSIMFGDVVSHTVDDKVTISNHIRKIESAVSDVVFEKKIKIKTINIYMPQYKYDVRISISKETKVESKDFIVSRHQITRVRSRESYSVGPFSVDFTRTSKQNSDDETNDRTYEVEVELKNIKDGIEDFASLVFGLPLLKR